MIKTEIRLKADYSMADVKNQIAMHLPISLDELSDVDIVKKELIFDNGIPSWRLSAAISLSEDRERGLLKMKKKVSEYKEPSLEIPVTSKKCGRVVVVGAGPAGLFSALYLAMAGANPTVIERGEDVDSRSKTVKDFMLFGRLSEESNVQFGEGGAGTFSDGKLKVGSMDKYKWFVLSKMVEAGAPREILYLKGAHLGTDKLPQIVKKIRERICSLGGEFLFKTKLTDVEINDGVIASAICERNGEKLTLPVDKLILATGHSAEDTFRMLLGKGVKMESRGFGIGMRVEHKREYIDKLILKEPSYAASFGTASYHLVTHLPSGRSVYSFCMCPGGVVVPAASLEGGVVTNGMSEYSRMADNSNSAILVSVDKNDFESDSPLAGIELQRKIERLAYKAGGGEHRAPYITLGDFLNKRNPTQDSSVIPSYQRGVTPCRAEEYLPDYITDSLRLGFSDFDEWLDGFSIPEAVLTGAETRSTSPVKIPRNERYESVSVKGIYPIGEGAGYSGGIVSSATDGVRCAETVMFSD